MTRLVLPNQVSVTCKQQDAGNAIPGTIQINHPGDPAQGIAPQLLIQMFGGLTKVELVAAMLLAATPAPGYQDDTAHETDCLRALDRAERLLAACHTRMQAARAAASEGPEQAAPSD